MSVQLGLVGELAISQLQLVIRQALCFFNYFSSSKTFCVCLCE
jgi:hypothetical protein